MIHLLDVNALVAIGLPEHAQHHDARRWFSHHRAEGWATSAVTQSGFVRVASLTSAGTLRTPEIALKFLEQATADAHHVFWKEDQPVIRLDPALRGLLRGGRQVTDFLLLDLAVRNGGKLATFDGRLVRAVAGIERLAASLTLIS